MKIKATLVFLYLALNLLWNSATAQVCFQPAVNYDIDTSIGPCWITTADFNEDGNIDLVASTLTTSYLAILFGQGNGGNCGFFNMS